MLRILRWQMMTTYLEVHRCSNSAACMFAGRLQEEVWDQAQANVLQSAELLHLRDAAAEAQAAKAEIAHLREVGHTLLRLQSSR